MSINFNASSADFDTIKGIIERAAHERAEPHEHYESFDPIYGVPHADDDDDQRCTNPRGHEFECTGTAYGGDDSRWHGEGRCLCIHCGADGDA